MRKRPFALLLVTLGCASIAAALSCSGPIGPSGDSVTGPPGSPGPTGPTGQQGPTGSIGGLPPSSLSRHVVVYATNSTLNVSWDMLQVGGDFFGPTSAADVGQFHAIPSNSWARVVVLSLSTAATEVGLTDNLADVPTPFRGERQIGWARSTGSGLIPFRQVDHDVRYFPPVSLLSGVGAAGTFTTTSIQTAVPPDVREVLLRSHVFIPSGAATNQGSAALTLGVDGSTGSVIGQCPPGADGLGGNTAQQSDCVSGDTLTLDVTQQLFYKLGGTAAKADLFVTGYRDETL